MRLLFVTAPLLMMCFLSGFSQSNRANIILNTKNSISGIGTPSHITVSAKGKQMAYQTDSNGHVVIPLASGRYNLKVESNGFTTQNASYTMKGADLRINVSLDERTKREIPRIKDKTLISGYVIDRVTNRAISGARLSLIGYSAVAETGNNGYFELLSPVLVSYSDSQRSSRFSLSVSKQGYKDLRLDSLYLVNGRTMLKISLDQGGGNSVLRLTHRIFDHLPKDEPRPAANSHAPATQFRPADPTFTCTVPANIRLYHGDNNGPCNGCNDCSVIEQMSLETYVQTGLDDEWIAGWNDESLLAGAVAYRTYGAYYVLNPMDSNYDIVAFPCRQHWNGNTSYQATIDAANNTAGIVLINGPGAIIKSEYAAETNGFCTQGDCYSGQDGYWPCFADSVCCGQAGSGHGRGMCQWGSHRWAQQGKDHIWILDHYYLPGGYMRCQ